MAYSYQAHRSFVFTEEGQQKLLAVIAVARRCLDMAGAVRAGKLLAAAGSGDSWDLMAVVERLQELGYLARIECGAWQDCIYVSGGKGLP